MDMEFLGDSTCVRAAGYEAGYITIEFQDGTIYTYSGGITPQKWGAFKRATSKGEFFNYNLRNIGLTYFKGTAPDTGPLKYIDEAYFDNLEFDT